MEKKDILKAVKLFKKSKRYEQILSKMTIKGEDLDKKLTDEFDAGKFDYDLNKCYFDFIKARVDVIDEILGEIGVVSDPQDGAYYLYKTYDNARKNIVATTIGSTEDERGIPHVEKRYSERCVEARKMAEYKGFQYVIDSVIMQYEESDETTDDAVYD